MIENPEVLIRYEEYVELVEQYRHTFGEPPPLWWRNTDESFVADIERMREAILLYRRPIELDVSEDVLSNENVWL